MKLYNTLTRQEEEFLPDDRGRVRMYVCGVTPYAPCHLGHAMSYVVFDVLRRYLEFLGYQVDHVQNFTDVDDKILHTAQQEGVAPQELAERHIQEFMSSMDVLNVKRARAYPRATEEIPNMVRVIGSLVEKGYAYPSKGDVYFRVTKMAGYGKMSRRTLEGMKAGARIEVGAGKEHPMDFALWKAAKEGELCWESPWGPGRPGWHIECSAMALEYLGETVDIHGGGQDLVFPHHENETAQSEAHTGVVPFARYWVHNGLLQMGEDKMSKSTGNLVPLGDALKRFSPDALRLFFLTSHYRGPLRYTDDGLTSNERAADRLRNALRQSVQEGNDSLDPEPYRRRFVRAMDSDLNTPQALAALFDLARDINRSMESGEGVYDAQDTLSELGNVLGLTLQRPQRDNTGDSVPFIDLLIQTRWELKSAKQFAMADQIRERLAELGVELEDTPEGTEWKYH